MLLTGERDTVEMQEEESYVKCRLDIAPVNSSRLGYFQKSVRLERIIKKIRKTCRE
jgi:hypothetical protein